MGELVPRKTMVKQAMMGIGGIGGGIAILLLSMSSMAWWAALILGGIIGVIGFAISTSKKDRTAGLITLGAGALLAVSPIPIIGGLAGFILGVAGVALLVVGAISVYKFIKNLNARR